MGDIVEKRLELYADDLLKLEQNKIFTKEEIRKINVKTRDHEHKLVSGGHTVDLYLDYVKFEKSILVELQKRQNHKEIAKSFNWIFINRVSSIYKRALKRFPTNYSLHMNYFEWITYFPEMHKHVAGHVKILLTLFPHIAESFIKAAFGYYQIEESVEKAREVLLQGQSRHPRDLNIYIDLIELEIRHPTKNQSDLVLEKYIDEILKNVYSHKFIQEVVKILEQHPHLRNIVDYAITKMLDKYKNEPQVYNFVAIRELEGKFHPYEEPKSFGDTLKRVAKRYKDSIAKLPEDKRPILWKMYLESFTELYKSKESVQARTYFIGALSAARKAKVSLDESHYIAWAGCYEDNHEFYIKKLQEGLQNYNDSIELWTLYLQHYLYKNDTKAAKEVFERAVTALADKSVPIWELYIDYHTMTSSVNEVERLFEKAINQHYPEVSRYFKPQFLTWTVTSKGIEEARALYFRVVDDPPFSQNLHQEMFLAELQTCHSDMGPIKRVFELWAKQFSAVDPNVYLKEIATIETKQEPDMNEQICKIFEKARQNMSKDKAVLFERKFNG